MWRVKFAINIKMQLGGAVVSTAPFCFVDAFCFVGAVLALASGKAERRQLHHSALLVQLRQLHPLISMRNVEAGSCALFTRLARVKGCHP